MNIVTLTGRLTKDPEFRFLPSGKPVANFTLAVDKNLSKEKKQEMIKAGKPTADFIKIVVFGKQAENCATYLSKGNLVGINGRIQTRTYENSNSKKVYVTEVVANRVEFLNTKNTNNDTKNNNDDDFYSGFNEVDDEIPF